MVKEKLSGARWVIPATLLLAILLNVLPYPDWAKFAHPDWLTLTLFYWCLMAPRRVGVVYGWCCGLMLDLIHSALPGQYALGKALVALVAVGGRTVFRYGPPWQQCAVLLVLVTLDIAVVVWIHHLAGGVGFRLIYWQSALTTALLWPLAYGVLRRVHRWSGIER